MIGASPLRHIACILPLCIALLVSCSPSPTANLPESAPEQTAVASIMEDQSRPETPEIGLAVELANIPDDGSEDPSATPVDIFAPRALVLAPSATPAAPPTAELPRANPSYIQWLERQSLLRATPELTAIVSGSSLPWRSPSTLNNINMLLESASIWLRFDPYRAAWDNGPAMAALVNNHFPARMAELGIHGLLLAPSAAPGSEWAPDGNFNELGRDIVNFNFAQAVGEDSEYFQLEDNALAAQVLLGGDVLPAATGIGPDFFLAARGVREYPGLYMMVEVPDDAWTLLPLSRINEGSSGRALAPQAIAQLAERGIIPPAFSRDADPAAQPGGWAATPEIVGVDGVNRRWLYRYSGSLQRPVLNWDDPSGTARRVLSASVIRQVGILHQPLVGLHIESLWGQDAAAFTEQPSAGSPEPALSALRALSREIHRYGACSLLQDALPARLLLVIQDTGIDFAADSVTTPALEYAMLTGDTAPLVRAIDESLKNGVDHARLWRAPADGSGVRFEQEAMSAEKTLAGLDLPAAWRSLLPVANNTLYVTAAALAALADGQSPDEARLNSRQPLDAQTPGIQAAHTLQIAFRAMQPGLLVLSGQDLEGTLFAPEAALTPFAPGAWNMGDARQISTHQGLPVGNTAYPPLALQMNDKASFAHKLIQLAEIRQKTGVARGKLVGRTVTSEPAVVGVLTALPDGGHLLVAGNFSQSSFVVDVNLPQGLVQHNNLGMDMLTGNSVALNKDHMQLRMQPWQYRIVLLRAAK